MADGGETKGKWQPVWIGEWGREIERERERESLELGLIGKNGSGRRPYIGREGGGGRETIDGTTRLHKRGGGACRLSNGDDGRFFLKKISKIS